MKKLKIAGTVLLSTFLFTACNDESLDIIENSPEVNGLKVITYGSGATGKSSGMTIAAFDSEITYQNYVEDLDAQVESWDDAFLAKWNHLSDDALAAKEEELNYDSEKPLTDFENQIGLQSLRKKYLAEEEAWLNNNVLNNTLDPDNKSEYDFDENEMAVLNSLSEVQIGTKIFKQLNEDEVESINTGIKSGMVTKKSLRLVEKGSTLVIEEEDYDALIAFNDGDISVIDNDNVDVGGGSTGGSNTDTNQNTGGSCDTGKEKKVQYNFPNSRHIRVKIKVRGPFLNWNGKVKAKLRSFKHNGRRWKKHRANITAGARGYYWNGNCNRQDPLNGKKTKRRKKKVKYSYKSSLQNSGFHAKRESLIGTYIYNGTAVELPLTW